MSVPEQTCSEELSRTKQAVSRLLTITVRGGEMPPGTKTEELKQEIAFLLSLRERASLEFVHKAAEQMLLSHCSEKVYYRGLIEFSNICARDCHYCGIRRSNRKLKAFMLSQEEIVEIARWCAQNGYGSVVLQSGERSDQGFVSYVEQVLRAVKRATQSEKLPQGVGITLCVGEQSRQTYERFYEAGAHRYLLRVETTNPELFARIHPPRQKLEKRIECLETLKQIGYQLGTGVMIGLPGQSLEMLAQDVLFFAQKECDMIGMGPYIPHNDTPMKAHYEQTSFDTKEALRLGLLMIAATRLLLKDVNIAATTALQAIDPLGREKGLRFGANVIMPQVTPTSQRKDYQLYEGKPCLEESGGDCLQCLAVRIASVGRKVGLHEWGDSPRARRRDKSQLPPHE